MLIEKTLFETINKVEIAIDRIQSFEPKEGYYLAFSGGKDSIVLADLCRLSGVKYELYYNITTVDPPELLKFIHKYYPKCIAEPPDNKMNMWKLIEKNGCPPYRQIRYCCRILKERGGIGRFVLTGLRWAESPRRRATRKMTEVCWKNPAGRYLHPIIDWLDEDVWEYIKKNKLPYCSLYDEGWHRIGCIGCPNSGKTKRIAFTKYPKIAEMYKKAIIKCYNNNIAKGKKQKYSSGEEWFEKWSRNI